MMDFLSKILPRSTSSYFVVGLKPVWDKSDRRPVIQVEVDKPEDVAEGCRTLSQAGFNAYFGAACYGGAGNRKKVNTKALRSLWLDIDCERPTAEYPDLESALIDLYGFLMDAGLPDPVLVCSGQGLHVYWIFDRDVDLETWRDMAGLLAGAVQKRGLRVDSQRTEECTTALRPPGTFNYGRDGVARPVFILEDAGPVDPDGLRRGLQRYAGGSKSPKKNPSTAGIGIDFPGSNFSHLLEGPRDCDPAVLYETCAQIRHAGTPAASRSSWLYMLGVMHFCKDGREAAHVVSRPDAWRYNAAVLDQQFDSVGKEGPVLCETFKEANPGPCLGCKWSGLVSTPIHAAKRAMREAEEAKLVLSPPNSDGLIPYSGDKFKVIPGMGLYYMSRSDPTKKKPTPVLINENEFYVSEIQSDTEQIKEKRYFKIKVRYRDKPVREVYFSAREDASPQNFNIWMMDHGLLPVDPRHNKLMSDFMGIYLAALQNKMNLKERRNHFGWTKYIPLDGREKKDGLVVGETMYTAEGPKSVTLSEKCKQLADREYQSAGDLEAWKLVPDMYGVLDQKEAQLYMCASFAAPFIKTGIGTATNLIMNIWDARGGRGKTTLLRAVNSVWGHPSELTCSKSDTLSARFQVLGARRNLPFCMDELTTMQDADLAAMLFDIANGREKRKGAIGGAKLLNTGSWDTITFLTSNRSIYELMRNQSSRTTAEMMRVVELPCSFRNYSQTELGRYIEDCIYIMGGNYGLAGPAFIMDCLKNPDVSSDIARAAKKWDEEVRSRTEERFWSYGLGVVLAAGRLACRYGYLNYDMDALESWVKISLLPYLRAGVGDGVQTPAAVFGEFVNANIDKLLVVEAAFRPPGTPPPVMGMGMDGYVKRLPRDNLKMRYELDRKILYINCKELQKWSVRNRASLIEMLEDLKTTGVWKGEKLRRALAQGVSAFPNTYVTCYKFYLENTDIIGEGGA
jgi:hypothetical protein